MDGHSVGRVQSQLVRKNLSNNSTADNVSYTVDMVISDLLPQALRTCQMFELLKYLFNGIKPDQGSSGRWWLT